MEYLIAALGIIISALMNIPLVTQTSTQNKKKKIAKSLADLHYLIDKSILYGKEIIFQLEEIRTNKSNLDKVRVIIEKQIKNLKSITREIDCKFLYGELNEEFHSIDGDYCFELREHKHLYKVLNLYLPSFPPIISHIIDGKMDTLANIAASLYWGIRNTKEGEILICQFETTYIHRRELFFPLEKTLEDKIKALDKLQKENKIKINKVNVIKDQDWLKFKKKEMTRLEKLQNMNNKLGGMIKKYYDPHLII